MATKVTTDQIGKEKIDIFVDSSGMFYAEFDEDRYEDTTRVALLERLKKAVKSKETQRAIPVTLVNVQKSDGKGYSSEPYEAGRGILHAKLRGKHGREWNAWLFVTEDGKQRFKMSRHSGLSGLTRRLTAEEIAEYERLTAAIDTAEAAFAAWLEPLHVSPEEALKLV